ncbi:hypothetical protein ACC676_01160 [Rhizobium ruizarguesonis]
MTNKNNAAKYLWSSVCVLLCLIATGMMLYLNNIMSPFHRGTIRQTPSIEISVADNCDRVNGVQASLETFPNTAILRIAKSIHGIAGCDSGHILVSTNEIGLRQPGGGFVQRGFQLSKGPQVIDEGEFGQSGFGSSFVVPMTDGESSYTIPYSSLRAGFGKIGLQIRLTVRRNNCGRYDADNDRCYIPIAINFTEAGAGYDTTESVPGDYLMGAGGSDNTTRIYWPGRRTMPLNYDKATIASVEIRATQSGAQAITNSTTIVGSIFVGALISILTTLWLPSQTVVECPALSTAVAGQDPAKDEQVISAADANEQQQGMSAFGPPPAEEVPNIERLTESQPDEQRDKETSKDNSQGNLKSESHADAAERRPEAPKSDAT